MLAARSHGRIGGRKPASASTSSVHFDFVKPPVARALYVPNPSQSSASRTYMCAVGVLAARHPDPASARFKLLGYRFPRAVMECYATTARLVNVCRTYAASCHIAIRGSPLGDAGASEANAAGRCDTFWAVYFDAVEFDAGAML
ncbi:hypothetical protein EVG20_g11137 [Dentipellis fragilis]|uniref:Uncharacterized protein n=1 Tax=Dentipellis fragilis TaxID=205917 RepID=A0A4Y9XM44_9AGAM|nr:hypothetical protein EVG20_g11137 [Dentipellis fragilis]